MIVPLDEQVTVWIREVTGAPVWLEAPRAHQERGVGLHLLSVSERTAERQTRRSSVELQLTYLIVVWGHDVSEEHALLGQLVEAALNHPAWELGLPGLEPSAWGAFDLSPRPSLLIHAPVLWERPLKLAPPVQSTVIKSVHKKVGPSSG